MPVNLGEILVWLVIGGLIGSFVGVLATGSREGFGRVVNFLLGMAGALVGGTLFQVFKIDLGLGRFKVTFEDLIAALIGSLFVIAIVRGIRTKRKWLYWAGAAAAAVLVVAALIALSRR